MALPSMAEVNKLRNDELKTHLKNSLSVIEILSQKEKNSMKEQPQVPFDMENLLARIDEKMQTRLDQFKDTLSQDLHARTQQQIDAANEPLKKKIVHLEKENENLKKSLINHQKFLETLDNQQRSRFIIITGVPELAPLDYNDDTAISDHEKVEMILEKIHEQDITIEELQRLGQRYPNRNRPIKVTVKDVETRNKMLEGAKHLKDHNTPDSKFNKIFLKKDQHPLVRQEWSRLYETQRQEKDKPENAGKEVMVNRKERTVTVNGEIVDKFQNF